MSWTTQEPCFASGEGKILLSSVKLPGQLNGPKSLLSVGTSGSITAGSWKGSAEVHSPPSGAKVKDEWKYTIIFFNTLLHCAQGELCPFFITMQNYREANLKLWAFKKLFQCNLTWAKLKVFIPLTQEKVLCNIITEWYSKQCKEKWQIENTSDT